MSFDLDITLEFDKQFSFIAGVDEVGRGPLAGPVVSACVLVPNPTRIFFQKLRELGVTDSKKLNHKKRLKILEELKITNLKKDKRVKVNWKLNDFYFSISEVSPAQIDKINILNASLLSMREAYCNSRRRSHHLGLLLIDGNKIPQELPQNLTAKAVVKGDSKSLVIGLASIIAKVYRDELMNKMNDKFPGYGFDRHAGYPTKIHLAAIRELGIIKHHRKTFKGVKEYV